MAQPTQEFCLMDDSCSCKAMITNNAGDVTIEAEVM